MSGEKRLVVISHGEMKLFDTLEEVDDYDQDDIENGVEYWDTEEEGIICNGDTIVSHYNGQAAIR